MSTSSVATEAKLPAWLEEQDAELQAWLEEQDAKAEAEAARRKQAERAARKFNFEHAKFDLKLKCYARAIGA